MADLNERLSDVSSARGAPMGRSAILDNPQARVRLFRVTMIDGDYDMGGAYWGGVPSEPLFCAWSDENDFQVFRRAKTRAAAKHALQEEFPDLQFHDGDSDDLDEFLQAYMTAALWSSTDDDGESLDRHYGPGDLAPETVEQMRSDCVKFLTDNAPDLVAENCRKHGPDFNWLGHAGHDFWLTRNGHGAGFWDSDWEKAAGERLAAAARKFREVDLYIGEDKKIHAE